MDDPNNKIKQQIVEKIKASANILLTVGNNPSVDDLSAAIGLAALLNKLDKHATAVFSGAIPPAITFLDPAKVFENNIDSLRDFIIALDKEKADHLRYKVEGDLVKIFITPYRTTISNEDLEFSHGDFNIDLIMVLGASNKEDLDKSIEAHGNILQNVSIISLSAGMQVSQLGNINWNDDTASSLSEMIAGIGEAMKSEKPLLDQQIATALLTGIVFSTARFSNAKTTSKVMTLAAQLMAAGADQQLIAAQLQESHEINSLKYSPIISKNGEPINAEVLSVVAPKPVDGSLSVQHAMAPVAPVISPTVVKAPEKIVEAIKPEINLPKLKPVVAPVVTPVVAPPIVEPPVQSIVIEPTPITVPAPAPQIEEVSTTVPEPASSDTKPELETQPEKIILKHAYMTEPGVSTMPSAINSIGQEKEVDSIDIFNDQPMMDGSTPDIGGEKMGQQAATIIPPSEVVKEKPVSVSPIIDLPMPPPLPDFSTLPPAGIEQPTFGADTTQQGPSEFSTLPPVDVIPAFDADISHQVSPDMSTLPPQVGAGDPSQFRIPGQ